MALVADIKNAVTDITPITPIYVAVGVTDLAAERVRQARAQAVTVRGSLSLNPRTVEKKARERVMNAPVTVLSKTIELAGLMQEQHDALAARGEELLERIQNQRATQDLVAQVEQTAAFAKGAVTTFRKAASRTESSAKATLTTGRHQAGHVADVVSGVVVRDLEDARSAAAESLDTISDAASDAARRTATAAKRTTTTARRGADASTSRARAAATVARKTAPRVLGATEAAVEKVGDLPAAPVTTTETTVEAGPAQATVRVTPTRGAKKSAKSSSESTATRTVKAGPVKAKTTTGARKTATRRQSASTNVTAKKSTAAGTRRSNRAAKTNA
jgi:heparin binding hemagglutinin HbhA